MGFGPIQTNGDPDRIRTCDLQIRNLSLYPAELRDHGCYCNQPQSLWQCRWPFAVLPAIKLIAPNLALDRFISLYICAKI